MDLDFVRMEYDIIVDETGPLFTLLHDALRTYETHFRAACCQSIDAACSSCSRNDECPYRIVFDQGLSSDPEIVRLHQKPSLPYSLYIRGAERSVTTCSLGLVVIGSAVNYVELFHAAVLRMVESALVTFLPRAAVTHHTYSLDYHGARHDISDITTLRGSVILLSGQHILHNTVHCESVLLSLISPLRLLTNGSIAHRFDFPSFFRSQLRRCSSLCAYYGSGTFDLDFVRLSECAQNVAVFEDKIRYTQPQWSPRLNRAGLLGTIECTDLIEPMFSLLLLGSYFNAGKGATLGAGFYKVEVM